MVHLIHRKPVPLLHNTVLILCIEGDRLVAMIGPFALMHGHDHHILCNSMGQVGVFHEIYHYMRAIIGPPVKRHLKGV